MKKRDKGGGRFIKFLDTVITVSGEMVPDNGEDSYAYSLNDEYGMIAVFDGCGGIGSRKYEEYGDKTGAYIASHTAARVVLDWFDEFYESGTGLSGNTISGICRDIRRGITDELQKYEQGSGVSIIKGSMIKRFPTTGSIVLFTNSDNRLYSAYVWAGDSRGFLLTSSGLTQLTRDDIEKDADAMENLSNDGRLTNVISADGDYTLNSKIVSCEGPAVLVTATDGCFSYFYTPMEFEYMLLETLQESNTPEEWERHIDSYIRQYAADDYTLVMAVYGFGSMRRLKRSMARRYEEMRYKYISVLRDADDKKKEELWNEYKVNFYREA